MRPNRVGSPASAPRIADESPWPRLLLGAVFAAWMAALTAGGCATRGGGAAEDGTAETGEAASAVPADSSNSVVAGGDGAEEEADLEAVPVEVVTLEKGRMESVIRSTTNLEAERRVAVYSKAQAMLQVRALFVEEGDRVQPGELLLRLEDDEAASKVAKVQAQLARAEREFHRQQRLYEEGMTSEQAFSDASYERDQLRIELADAHRELEHTQVRAPIAGTVTRRSVNLGDQVRSGQELFEIVDFGSLVAPVYVPERHLPELRSGLTARVKAPSLPGLDVSGSVSRIAPVVDARSGTVRVTVSVPNRRGIRPGLFVEVDLITATLEDVVLIPKQALVYDQDRVFLFRLGDDLTVERVFITPERTDAYSVQPEESFAPGERVVTAGQAGLKDGSKVEVVGGPGEDDAPPVVPAEPETTEITERR